MGPYDPAAVISDATADAFLLAHPYVAGTGLNRSIRSISYILLPCSIFMKDGVTGDVQHCLLH